MIIFSFTYIHVIWLSQDQTESMIIDCQTCSYPLLSVLAGGCVPAIPGCPAAMPERRGSMGAGGVSPSACTSYQELSNDDTIVVSKSWRKKFVYHMVKM